MGDKLVIVESPAKAKTIQKYLGRGYRVTSSMGHVRDLPKKDLSIDVENNFEPVYEVTKQKVVSELRQAIRGADAIYLATDPDREGEDRLAHHPGGECAQAHPDLPGGLPGDYPQRGAAGDQ